MTTTGEQPGAGGANFVTTRWRLILSAGHPNTPESREALEILCRAYWMPIYAYARQHGHSPEDAEDLTQAFFNHLLEQNVFGQATPGRGRFRAFLLSSLKHFMVSEWRKANTQRHGGGVRLLSLDSLDFQRAEAAHADQAANTLSPDLIYEKRWALSLMERALGRLKAEYRELGKQALFGLLAGCVWGEEPEGGYGAVARRLRLTEEAVKSAAYRLRQHGREILREEVAQTVERPEEVESELRHLVEVLSR